MNRRTTVKVSKDNHDLVRAIADKSGLSVAEVLDRLIQQGLDTTKEIGQVIGEDDRVFNKLQGAVKKLHGDINQLREDIGTRLEDLEAEVAEEGGAAVELTQEDLIGEKDHKPGERVEDHTIYYCKACAAKGVNTALDAEDQPEQCPECNDKLDWKTVQAEGSKALGWVAIGVLALALLAGKAPGVLAPTSRV